MSPEPSPSVHRRRSILRFFLWVLALLVLVPRVLEIPVHVERDTNEGWNAVLADALARGESIYFPEESLLRNTYPPLSFHTLALFPDSLVAGRCLALLSLLLTAGGIGSIVSRTGGDGVAAAGLLVAFMGSHHAGYVAMNDPHWFGLAWITAGLVCLVRSDARGGGLVAAAGLMVVGGLVKHSLIAIPLAITVWLWRESRAELARWLVASLLWVLAGLVWIGLRHGSSCFQNMTEVTRGFEPSVALVSFGKWLAAGAFLLFLAGAGLQLPTGGRWRRLVALAMLFSALVGVKSLGGWGVDRNVLFELILVSVWAAGWAIGRTDHAWWRGWAAAAVVTLVIATPGRLAGIGSLATDEPSWLEDIRWLRDQPGPVASDLLGMLHWSGHRMVVEDVILAQRLRHGVLQPDRVIEADVPLWHLPRDGSWPLPDPVHRERLLAGHDKVRESPNGVFYRRRGGKL